VKGGCVPNQTGGTCTTNNDCPSGAPACIAGHCTPTCTTDAQCPAGDYCNQGACAPDTRPTPTCTANHDTCATSQQCISGYCRYTCTDSHQCALIDARIPVCASDGVCRSAAEGNPQCTSKDQCQAGQDCVGNVCK
jgi:hypothetical protein